MSNFSKRENLDCYIALLLCLTAFGVGLWYVIVNPKVEGIYDCSISEISADIPIAVKEKCRQLRAEKFNKDLQKPK